jgi:hypothetical protein
MLEDSSKVKFVSENNPEVFLTCTPLVLRRIHSLNLETLHLEYSHTDLVVTLESGEDVMIEFVQAKLSAGNYRVFMNGQSFPILFNQNETECLNYCKTLVFACYPDLEVQDVYGKEILRPVFRRLYD